MNTKLTNLNYAILGALLEKPLTGYQIRKIFETTAMGQFSESTGSIYPAIKKLQAGGYLLKTKIQTKDSFLLSPSPSGKEILKSWVSQPLSEKDISKDMDIILLKYVFQESLLTSGQKKKFLSALKELLGDYSNKLEQHYKAASKSMTPHGKQAFRLGLSVFQLQFKWAKKMLKNL